MNERIRELAEQANAWYPQGYPSAEGGDEAWKNLVIFEKEDLQKFAELIVKECLTFVEPMPGSGDIDDLALEAAYNQIKEHFGVE